MNGLGLRKLCSKFCPLFYSALPKKCSDFRFSPIILSKKSLFHIMWETSDDPTKRPLVSSGQLHSSLPQNQILLV